MLKAMLEEKMKNYPHEAPKENEDGASGAKLHLTAEHLPEVAHWKDGESYYVVTKVKQVSEGEFEVEEAAAINEKQGEEELEETGEEEQAESEQE